MNDAGVEVWQRNPLLAWREIDEETVIISPNESVMHELNDTGSFIWKHIDGLRTAEEIAALLAGAFEVEPGVALADTNDLMLQLSEKQLLIPAGQNGAEQRR